MITDEFKQQCQTAFDEGFDDIDPTWKRRARVGKPVIDFVGVQTYGKLCKGPAGQRLLDQLKLVGRNGATVLNQIVDGFVGGVEVRFLNGVERPTLDFSEVGGEVEVRCYFDFGVEPIREVTIAEDR